MNKTKKILGLDLGTTSIGWALIEEGQNIEDNKIIKLGVRVNPLTTDEQKKFNEGKPMTTVASRTQARGARRNLQRFKLRRQALIELLRKNNWITHLTALTETGKNSTHETLRKRSQAASEKISLIDLSRVLLSINKKRGYKSNRKANNEDEGALIDGMAVAKQLYDQDLTPGQFVHRQLEQGRTYIPSFYKSDLEAEIDRIWNHQKEYYPDFLTNELYDKLKGQGKKNTQKRILAITGIFTAENKGKRAVVKKTHYEWRSRALDQKLSKEIIAYVLVEINNNINSSSAYLGAISDRSKNLYFSKQTVGQYLYQLIQSDPHISLKNKVFYRQDYLDEFERIWTCQSGHHPELTPELKEEIRDIVIFYQRKLKSQKGLISHCQFESREVTFIDKLSGKTKIRSIGPKVIPKSSPLFQEFKIWQTINSLILKHKRTNQEFDISIDDKEALFNELNLRGNLSQIQLIKFLGLKSKDWETNYKEGIAGNKTSEALYNAYQLIAESEGYGFDWNAKSSEEIKAELLAIFPVIGIDSTILNFNYKLDLDAQKSYQLWHLLYATEEDDRISPKDVEIYGTTGVTLKKKLIEKFGFKPSHAKLLAAINLQDDYGSLSAKSIRKIMPHLQSGHVYSEACQLAGYNHSNSQSKEEQASRILDDKLTLLRKNELRQPIVEKILNQMVHVVNQIIDTYGKPDEVRIELARELKNSAKQRALLTTYINSATRKNDDIKKLLRSEFGLANPTKNDVVKYKLWDELRPLGYKTLFTGQQISQEKLFTKEIDIEHIIPRALFFDDSYSNKTLAYRDVNLQKANRTAIDFIDQDSQGDLEAYRGRVDSFLRHHPKSKSKHRKLLMTKSDIGDSFTNRDMVQTQYISKKAKDMLQKVIRTVTPSIGPITVRMREEWGLMNVMRELNLPKYKAVGLTEIQQRKYGNSVEVIKDWTKRNDHRHHAMDALAVAFTSPSHVQFINNLKGAQVENSQLYGLKNKLTEISPSSNGRRKRKFKSPMDNFRAEAKKHLQDILISYKTKNKVVTPNVNRTKMKGKDRNHSKIQMTPRGQLHKETVYGQIKRPMAKLSKLNSSFTLEMSEHIVNPNQKSIVVEHLAKYQQNPKVAFATKTLKKDPLLWKEKPLKEVICYETIYTIRKEINSDFKSFDKIIDPAIRKIILNRISSFGGDRKKALSDLDSNPIWLNEEKKICIKRVTIKGVNEVVALHYKKDHLGRLILDTHGQAQPVDFVSTGNNHHVAIYRDADGKMHERVVSFFEAVRRATNGLELIDKTYNYSSGWQFLFTLKQNEMFVFPSENFDPSQVDLLDPKKTHVISPHLFRVQKISTKNYLFTHHYESMATTSDDLKMKKQLIGKKYHFIQSANKLLGIIKVRLNHIGQIVQIGE